MYLTRYPCLLSGPPPPEGFAVIAWLHGGDFSAGSPLELDPFQLVLKQKVIVVTIAYRLNIFGFFTSIDGESPGNFGLMDQSAALFWIKKNIKLFGGNETNITLMGHGSGAISAGLHLTSGEWTQDMYQRAIIMSGSAFLDSSVREPKSYMSALDRTASAFGCFRRPTSMLLDCLRNVPAQVLSDSSPVIDWGPIIDEGLSNTTTPFIRDYPRLLAERGMLRSVPTMLGYTDMEEILDFVGDMQNGMNSDMYDTVLGESVLSEIQQYETNDTCGGNTQFIMDAVNFLYKPYPPTNDQMVLRQKLVEFTTERKYASKTILLANYMSKQSDAYVYRFDMKARTMAVLSGYPEWVGVPQKFDLLFVWGLPYWTILPNNTQWDTMDKRISDIVMTLWANFAKYGNPTQTGVYIKWEKYTADDPGILVIDRAFNMSDRSNMNYGAYHFWNEYYPRVVAFAAQCCNATDSASPMLLVQSITCKLLLSQLIILVLSAMFFGK